MTTRFYPTQIDEGDKIIRAFQECIVCSFLAPVQWGKTGVMVYVAEQMVAQNMISGFSNAFIITGMSDNEWKTQTQERVPDEMKQNVLHRCDIWKESSRFVGIRDALIIIDECHFGSKSNMTISDFFGKVGLADINELRGRNIRILQSSATPDAVFVDSQCWPASLHVPVVATIPPSYVGFDSLYRSSQVREIPKDPEEIVSTVLGAIEDFDKPRYHLVRVLGRRRDMVKRKQRELLVKIARKRGYSVVFHDSNIKKKERITDEMLSNPPKVHTIVIVKGLWRAAKTIPHGHLGVVYCGGSRLTSVEAQGLAGRMCGHNKKHDIVLFVNEEAITQYQELVMSRFDYSAVEEYYASGMRIKEGELRRITPTYMNPTTFKGLEDCQPPEVVRTRRRKPAIHNRITEGEHYELVRTEWRARSNESSAEFFARVKSESGAKYVRNPFSKKNLTEDGKAMSRLTPAQPKRVFTLEEFTRIETERQMVNYMGVNGKVMEPHDRAWKVYVVYDGETPIIITYEFVPLKTLDL